MGRPVAGHAAIFETEIRPPNANVAVGVAWIDSKLLAARLYSGSDESPGPGNWRLTAPVTPTAAATLVAAFNGGFKLPVAEGGYYTQGVWVVAPRWRAASLVIYADGTASIGAWGVTVHMTPRVVDVLQNLSLLVNGGRPVTTATIAGSWGATVGGVVQTWRSGLGVTRNGALVYVSGPALDPRSLAEVLVRAGAVRAMELDINPDWPAFATYRPATTNGLATPANGTNLIAGTVQGPATFFEPSWARDFITLSAKPTGTPD